MAWMTVTWGALAYSAINGAATDYPRFATLLLAPLAVSAAAALAWLSARSTGNWRASDRARCAVAWSRSSPCWPSSRRRR